MFTGRLLPHSVQHSRNGGKRGGKGLGGMGKGIKNNKTCFELHLEINFIHLFTLFWTYWGKVAASKMAFFFQLLNNFLLLFLHQPDSVWP